MLSVFLVMIETVEEVEARYDTTLFALEWIITIVFTVEYLARLATVEDRWRYGRSFFGVVDLLSILPVYLSLVLPGAQSLLVIRSLRLIRVFRILKLAQFVSEENYLVRAIRASARKVMVFLIAVVLINVIVGSTMYLIEGPENGYDSMFRGVYWSIVTMSTVGFGDIAPSTTVGQVLAAALMITGYSVIAVPTGIVSAEVAQTRPTRQRSCSACGASEHATDARFCGRCGADLSGEAPDGDAAVNSPPGDPD